MRRRTMWKFGPMIQGGVLLTGAVLTLLYAGEAARGVAEGLHLCLTAVIPSLFLFLVLSRMLCLSPAGEWLSQLLSPITRWIFHCPPQWGSLILMSLLGGYPVGAVLLAQELRRGALSSRQASLMLPFCCNAGPAFLLTTVGRQFFGSLQAGLALLLSQTLTALLIGWISGRFLRKEALPTALPRSFPPFDQCLVESVAAAGRSMAGICLFVMAFSGAGAVFSASGLFSGKTILPGLLEVTSGCRMAAESPWAHPLGMASLFLGFGGLSVLMQVRQCFRGLELSFRPFYLARVAGGILNFLCTELLLRLWPDAIPAGMIFVHRAGMAVPTWEGTFCLVGLCTLFLLSLPGSHRAGE